MSPFLGFGFAALAAAAFLAASASAAFFAVLHDDATSVKANNKTLIEFFNLTKFLV